MTTTNATPRWFWLTIALLVCSAAAALHQRNRIRAHWWVTRLVNNPSADPAAQAYCLASLAAVGDQAAGAVQRLARHDRSEVRALAVVVLARWPGEDSLDELRHLMADADPDVAESAALSLAFLGGTGPTRRLIDAVGADQPSVAMAAAAALSRSDSPEALTTLCDLASRHPRPRVRAQAVESLAAWTANALLGRAQASGDGEALPRAFGHPATRHPIDVLVDALDDQATFQGHLSLERQIASAALAAGDRENNAASDGLPEERTVAQIAADALERLTGLQCDPSVSTTAAQRAQLADRCRRLMGQRQTPAAHAHPSSEMHGSAPPSPSRGGD